MPRSASGTSRRGRKRRAVGGQAANPQKIIPEINPLLIPSVLVVLQSHAHAKDIPNCLLVCKEWNKVFRRRSNPLINQKILSVLVKHMPETSLLQSRLVCWSWNHGIVNSTRWVDPNPDYEEMDRHTYFTGGFGGIDRVDFQRFHDKFGDPSNLPLPLCFTRFAAPNNISLSDASTKDFLSTYGRCLKSLQLYRCKWDLEDFRKTLFQFTSNLEHFQLVCGIIPGTQIGKGKKMITPELDVVLHEDPSDMPILQHMKSLSFDMNILDSKDNPRAYVEQFMTELLNSCPNLEDLNVNISSWYARAWVTDFIATNDAIDLKNLKSLSHIIDPDLPKIINLQLKQMPLSKLKIRIRYKNVTLDALHELLSSLKHTLTFLQIIFLEYKCAREFPSSQDLYKLKRLELWKYKGQLDFLKDFVSLEELLIGEMELKDQKLFNQRDIFKVVLPNLKKSTFKDYWEVRPFS